MLNVHGAILELCLAKDAEIVHFHTQTPKNQDVGALVDQVLCCNRLRILSAGKGLLKK